VSDPNVPVPGAAASVPVIDAVEQRTLPPIRPGAGWYVLAGVIIVGGLVAAFLLLVVGAFGYLRQIEDLARFDAPGPATLDLPAGDLVVYHEPPGGVLYRGDALALEVRDPAGDAVPVGSPQVDDTYVSGTRRGGSVATVEVPAPGPYQLSVDAGVPGSIAVGPEPGRRLTTYGWASLLVAGAAVIGGTALLVTVRRGRRRSQAARMAQVPASPRPAI
jgi:hypothetical protein